MNMSLIIAVAAAFAVTACGSKEVRPKSETAVTPPATITAVNTVIPAWYLATPPADSEAISVAGTGISRDLSMSVQKALLDAQNHIADRIAAEIDALTKSYRQDVGPNAGLSENTEQLVRKLVADIRVSGYSITNKAVLSEGQAYRTFIRLRYPTTDLYREVLRSNGTPHESRVDELGRELDSRKRPQRRSADPSPEGTSTSLVTPVTEPDTGLVIRRSFTNEKLDSAEED